MTYNEAVEYIEDARWSRSRPGLERIRALLSVLGEPQKGLRIVHVAGSNGKGSVCAMFSSVLREAGFKTGLFISPHVLDYREQMQISGEMIAPERFAQITGRVRAAADAMTDHPSRFEMLTAAALLFFREENCGAVVLEVGMGGALDSTNVIDAPELAVITSLSLEHTEYLGCELRQIAAAKAGIIKQGCSCVCSAGEDEAVGTVRTVCAEKGVPFRVADAHALENVSSSLCGQSFEYGGVSFTLPLLGLHQLTNASLVLCGIEALRARGWAIPPRAVQGGLAHVRWPARLELLCREPTFLLDGGHNPQCAQALAASLRELLGGKKAVFIVGMLADKDVPGTITLLLPFAERFVCLAPDSPRALGAADLAALIGSLGGRAQSFESADTALEAALDGAGDDPVVAFGSLYLASVLRPAAIGALKKRLRRMAIGRRDAFGPDERADRSAAACERIVSSDLFRRADTVMVYRAVRGELSLSRLEQAAAAAGKHLVYPRCAEGRELHALIPSSPDAWARGPYGISEPVPERSREVPPEDIDLVVCPCAAFDGAGARLGMGAGYYDRFLPRCTTAAIVAAAFECQRLELVPTDGYDVPMQLIFTEDGVYPA